MRNPTEYPDSFDDHGRIDHDPDHGQAYQVEAEGRSGAWVALILVAALLCLLSALGVK